ncbi:MAG TPA: CsbD family protein, partial [Hyphomonas sp.]|nr:CsbD family protein [Hyphomonas sp.]
MDKEHLKGGAKEAEGEVKETVGEMTDNKKMQAEGK